MLTLNGDNVIIETSDTTIYSWAEDLEFYWGSTTFYIINNI